MGCHYNINLRLVRRRVGEGVRREEVHRNLSRICNIGDEAKERWEGEGRILSSGGLDLGSGDARGWELSVAN